MISWNTWKHIIVYKLLSGGRVDIAIWMHYMDAN